MTYHLGILSNKSDNSYLDFLERLGEKNSSVLGYHYPFYRDMLVKINIGEPLYLGCWKNNHLVGMLPGFLKVSDIGTVYSSLPFFGPNAGVLCDNTKDDYRRIHSELLNYLLHYLRENIDMISASIYTPFLFKSFDIYDEILDDAIQVRKDTLFLDLNDIEWNSKLNYDIRKAKKAGVKIDTNVTDDRVKILYNIYKENCIDYGIPVKPFPAIDFLLKQGIDAGGVKSYFAIYNDSIIAALVVLWGPITVSYYLPCSLQKHRSLQANTLLIDYAIGDAHNSGLRFWNWEASPSKDSGVYKFKKKWGALDEEYRIYVKAFGDEQKIKLIGKEKILRFFPFYYVYPFNKLED